jgi:hypothetical protein
MKKNSKHLSTGEPTYWPSDRNKLPDLVDFCVTKGIPLYFAAAKSCFDLSSKISPVLITLTEHALNQEKQPSLSNRHTNWDDFRRLINQRLTLNVSLKTEKDIEAEVKFFSDTIQWADWNATSEHTDTLKTYDCPILIKQNIKEKEDSVEVGTDYKHQRAKHYLPQQHRNSNNSSIGTIIIASKHSCKVLHQQNPLTIPCGRRPRKSNMSRNLLRHLEHHKELGQEATSKKHMLSLSTWQTFFQLHPSENQPEEELICLLLTVTKVFEKLFLKKAPPNG